MSAMKTDQLVLILSGTMIVMLPPSIMGKFGCDGLLLSPVAVLT